MRLGPKNKTPIIQASKRSFVKNQINFSSVILGPLIEPQKQAPRPLELEIWQSMAWEDLFVIYVKDGSVTSRFLSTKNYVI